MSEEVRGVRRWCGSGQKFVCICGVNKFQQHDVVKMMERGKEETIQLM